MPLTTKPEATNQAVAADRRRPGRPKHVSPELIPLLRTSELPPTLDEGDEDMTLEDADQLSGLRGIAFGLALSVPLWVGIAYIGRWLLS